MAIFTDELSRLGESIIIVLHDEAALLPVAQEDGKLRLGAMNHTVRKHPRIGVETKKSGC